MQRKSVSLMVLAIFLFSIALASCAPAATPPATSVEQPTTAPQAPAATAAPTEVPPTAAAPTEAPTAEPATPAVDPTGQTITFWHVWGTGAPSDAMTQIVDQFNSTNEWGITVNAADQGNYSNLEDAMNAAIQSGDVPNLVVGYSNALANWAQVGMIADLNQYADDPTYGFTDAEKADFYPSAWNSAVIADGSRIGFPISQSANVIFYNQSWAKDLGFDNAPSTSDEFKAQACAAYQANQSDSNPDNDGTGGYVLNPGASDFASWAFAFGGSLVDENGYTFDTPNNVQAGTFLQGMESEKCAFQTESYPNPEFATRKALFTVSSTAGLPYQIDAFNAEGANTNDQWTFLPFPGPDGNKAVDAFGQTVGLVNTTPEQNMAAWLFLKYFSSPEVQVQWINASAYYPTRASVVPMLSDYTAANPIWTTGLDLLQYGKSEPARPSWTAVRRLLGDTFTQIIQATPDQVEPLLADLDTQAAAAAAETDQ